MKIMNSPKKDGGQYPHCYTTLNVMENGIQVIIFELLSNLISYTPSPQYSILHNNNKPDIV